MIDVTVPLITFIALTAVGMDLTPAHFRAVRHQPGTVIAGLLGPVLLLPVLALGLLAVFAPAPAVAAGLLLVASCPIGGISNTYSYLAQASTALSVTLTTLSSALAMATIPLVSWGFELVLDRSMGFVAPAILPIHLVLMLLLPVVTGMWLRHRWPDASVRRRASVQRVAFIALALLLGLIVASNVGGFVSGLSETVPLAVVFVAGSFGAGWLLSVMVGASLPDRFTIAAEFATRNVAVATAIAVTLLREPAFALFAATYFLTELPLMLLAVLAYRSSRRVTLPA